MDGPAGDGAGYLRGSDGELLEKWNFLEDYSESEIDTSGQEDFWDLDGFTEPTGWGSAAAEEEEEEEESS